MIELMIGYTNMILVLLGVGLFLQHIYGLGGYYFFASIMMGMFAYIVGVDNMRLLILFLSTLGSWLSMNLILRYIMLSVYPKYVFYIILSFMMMIMMWQGVLSYGYVVDGDGIGIMMLFSLVYMVSSIKVLQYMKTIWSGLRYILYIGLIGVYYFVWEYFYPVMIDTNYIVTLGLLGLIIIIGMYDGLQLKEMIRFRKLLMKRFKA